ncbi:L,D-transpeptidase family protein [candidate division KSB1 bacterium]|nr:L,D-transpeptidase family protein [candidate division KSB1 bacterium]
MINLKILKMRILIKIAILLLTISRLCESANFADEVSEQLRQRIESGGVPLTIMIRDEAILAATVLPHFYEQRVFEPAWSDQSGALPVALDLLQALKRADDEGLKQEDYHFAKIQSILRELNTNAKINSEFDSGIAVNFDLLCTDAFLIYGAHLIAGRIHPETIDPQWRANLREVDLAALLQRALDSNEIDRALKSLLPPQNGYRLLKKAYQKYRAIKENGGWTLIEKGDPLKIGDSNQRVYAVRQRLRLTSDLGMESAETDSLFDENLNRAVQIFQMRHGLDASGTVDAATLQELNVPVSKRLVQIRVNLERWRWLPQDLGERHILVNIANFALDCIDEGRSELNMRVIVGKQYRKTPVFSDKITYMVFNPYWHVPNNIAKQDILPLIKKDPEYLTKKKIKVFRSWEANTEEMNPADINWSEVTGENLTFRFRQDPGPENALGRIKFMFPNQFNVYLHDTPTRDLFQKSKRDFSSGCIRVENPIGLALFLLKTDKEWSIQKIEKELSNMVEHTIRLPEAVPVHLLYWTAWCDGNGMIQFRKDIYGRDRKLLAALNEEPYD